MSVLNKKKKTYTYRHHTLSTYDMYVFVYSKQNNEWRPISGECNPAHIAHSMTIPNYIHGM